MAAVDDCETEPGMAAVDDPNRREARPSMATIDALDRGETRSSMAAIFDPYRSEARPSMAVADDLDSSETRPSMGALNDPDPRGTTLSMASVDDCETRPSMTAADKPSMAAVHLFRVAARSRGLYNKTITKIINKGYRCTEDLRTMKDIDLNTLAISRGQRGLLKNWIMEVQNGRSVVDNQPDEHCIDFNGSVRTSPLNFGHEVLDSGSYSSALSHQSSDSDGQESDSDSVGSVSTDTEGVSDSAQTEPHNATWQPSNQMIGQHTAISIEDSQMTKNKNKPKRTETLLNENRKEYDDGSLKTCKKDARSKRDKNKKPRLKTFSRSRSNSGTDQIPSPGNFKSYGTLCEEPSISESSAGSTHHTSNHEVWTQTEQESPPQAEFEESTTYRWIGIWCFGIGFIIGLLIDHIVTCCRLRRLRSRHKYSYRCNINADDSGRERLVPGDVV